jgi:hypothetical protein
MDGLDVSPQSSMAPNNVHGVGPDRSMSIRVRQATGLTGLASFVAIMVAAFVLARPLWDAPGTKASGIEVAAYAHNEQGRELSSLLIYAVGIGLFLCFAASMWRWLCQIEPAPAPLSAVFAFGAVALVVLILAAFVTGGVLTYRMQQPAIAQVLRDVTFGLLAISGIPTAVCLGAYAQLIRRHGGLPVWTAWLAILGVIAHLFITASFIGHGSVLSVEGSVIVLVPGTFFAWILATSIALLTSAPKMNEFRAT